MSIVYGSYFSTSGGKNFVRPVIDYTVSYTATTVSVTYKAGINVKSGWYTNAKFTSTFSATGQASKTREDNNKNWQAGNHFIFGPTTITYSKTTSTQTKTLKMYSKTSVDSSSKSVTISIPALGLPTISDATAGRVESTPTSVTVSFKASSSNNSTITAKINGEVVTAVDGVYSKAFTNVSSDQHNYVITATDSVGTSTRTLTVPKLAPPQVDVICTRDETDATKAVFDITANSFYRDSISDISIVVGSTSATVTGGEINDSNALTVTKEFTGLAETALNATVSVTGYGGTTTLNVTVPSAFKTFDVGGKGKTIAFGMPAKDEDAANGTTIPENGLFECGMDADFKGTVSLDITKLGIADYIVEHGDATLSSISTHARWEKWASGKAVMEFGYSGTATASTVWATPIYYTDYTSFSNVFANVKSGLFIEPPNVIVTSNSSVFIGIIPSNITANGIGSLRYLSVNNRSSSSGEASFRAVGKWK